MKLLFYIDHFRRMGTGLENSAINVCEGLAKRGHSVCILANSADPHEQIDTIPGGLRDIETHKHRLKPDLCIDWGFFHPADLHRLGSGTHRGYIRHYLDAYQGAQRWMRYASYRLPRHRRIIARQQRLLQNPNAHILANSWQTARLAMAEGANRERVSVHHQAVDRQQFDPDRIRHQRSAKRREWGLAENDVAFGFIAHNLRLKNLALLRQVFSQLPQALNARLVVIGKRHPGFQAPWLIHAGQQWDMPGCYAALDGLLHPTWFDSCANVVMEAMSCALPVVVSDTSGVHEIIEHGENGFVLPVRGVKDEVVSLWAHQITSLCSAPFLAREIGQGARRLTANHTLEDYLSWFEKHLQMILDKKLSRKQP